LVLTHSDPDHVGLAAAFQEAGARVLIHPADQSALRTGKRKSTDGSVGELLRALRRPGPWRFLVAMLRDGGARPTRVDGAETFSDGDVLDVPGRPRVVATPGHTPGHCALHFESHDALFVGDGLCTLNPLDGSTAPQVMPPVMNVSTPQCYESLSRLEAVEAAGLLPGHGEPWRSGVGPAVAQARERRGHH
jgi:glyoxylase-like metal-dependent hydrolase (beta-lactamase superfamily II)